MCPLRFVACAYLQCLVYLTILLLGAHLLEAQLCDVGDFSIAFCARSLGFRSREERFVFLNLQAVIV